VVGRLRLFASRAGDFHPIEDVWCRHEPVDDGSAEYRLGYAVARTRKPNHFLIRA